MPVFIGIAATVFLFMLVRSTIEPSQIPWSWSEWLRGPAGFVLCALVVIYISHKISTANSADNDDPST